MRDIHDLLTAAWHIVGKLNYVDAIFNHISVASHDSTGRLIVSINPDGFFASEVKPSDWITFPLEEADSLDPEVLGVNADGYRLHSQLHRLRSRPGSVLHTHSEYALAVGATADGLLPLSQIAIEFVREAVCVDYGGLFRDAEMEPALKQLVQAGGVALLRNHGLLIVADNVEEAVYVQHYVELACKIQVLALSQGKSLLTPPDEIVADAASELRKDRSEAAKKLFEAFKRVLLQAEVPPRSLR